MVNLSRAMQVFIVFFQAEDGIRDIGVTGVQTCALPISMVLPNFPINDRDTKLRNTLLSAVFNTLIIGYMPDYTCLVTPLFRAMEFYLHRILSDKLGKVTTTSKGKNNFSYFGFDNSTNRYEEHTSELQSRQYLV